MDQKESCFRGSILIGFAPRRSLFQRADFSESIWDNVDSHQSNFSGSTFLLAHILGSHLSENDFSDSCFEESLITNSSFLKCNLTGTLWKGSNLASASFRRVDFSGADFRGASFRDSRSSISVSEVVLKDTKFSLQNPIPAVSDIHNKIYEICSAPNALVMDNWHTCNTTHCWAGWTIVLAGEAGKLLEDEVGPSLAASLIYHASDPGMEKTPNWFQWDERRALDQMRELVKERT